MSEDCQYERYALNAERDFNMDSYVPDTNNVIRCLLYL
jgi:hypothetical protein